MLCFKQVALVVGICALVGCHQRSELGHALDPEAANQIRRLREYVNNHPDDKRARLEMGRALIEAWMIEDGIEELQTLISMDPNHVEAYLLLSLAYRRSLIVRATKAIEPLEKAGLIEPGNCDVQLQLGYVYSELKMYPKAEKALLKAVELCDKEASSVSAHLGLAALYETQGQDDKAQQQYERACEIDPTVADAVRSVEIRNMTPSPAYVGDDFSEEGLHPTLDDRITRARKAINELHEDIEE